MIDTNAASSPKPSKGGKQVSPNASSKQIDTPAAKTGRSSGPKLTKGSANIDTQSPFKSK